jgi:NitT/TauT family transport system substrate-binding protein
MTTKPVLQEPPGYGKVTDLGMKYLPAIICLSLLLLLAPAFGAQEAALRQVSFIPQWTPQSQFAGYYVAYEKGFYQRRGLQVKIMRGGPNWPPSAMLANGRADFGSMMLTTGIIKRSQGVKLLNIGQIVQRSALMLVAKKASGINAPKDLEGKKVGLWGEDFQGQPKAFFRKYGLSVKLVPQSGTLNLFLRGGVDAASAMWYNEYHLLLNAGLNPEELTTFLLADHGLNSPEDGIYCREETFKESPERCGDFVRASIDGWRYAFAHPDEALDIVMHYVHAANIATNRVHQKWMLARMRDIIMPGAADAMGLLREEAYQRVAAELRHSGLINQIPPYAEFYDNCAGRREN